MYDACKNDNMCAGGANWIRIICGCENSRGNIICKLTNLRLCVLVHCVLCSLLTRLSAVATLGVGATGSIFEMGACLKNNTKNNNTAGRALRIVSLTP